MSNRKCRRITTTYAASGLDRFAHGRLDGQLGAKWQLPYMGSRTRGNFRQASRLGSKRRTALLALSISRLLMSESASVKSLMSFLQLKKVFVVEVIA